jgi:NAD(P)H-hydrate epimerase
MRVCTVEEMTTLDARAVQEYGIPDAILMENAGGAVYEAIRREMGVSKVRFVVLSGVGNNGGDGFVVARKLLSSGADVRTLVLGARESYSGVARQNLETLSACGASIQLDMDAHAISEALAGADAAVDALLGTGISRDVEGRFRQAIDALNASELPVYAVDIPSGVDGDTGRVRGVAVKAAATVTFGLPKRGHLLYPGADLCGRLYVSHISYPPTLSDAAEVRVQLNQTRPLPSRKTYGHKGSFGETLFVAGAASYYGAPSLSALSLLKAGGGYSRLAAPRSVTPHLAPLASEVVYMPQEETAEGTLALAAKDAILEIARGTDFVVLGPGVSLVDETQELVRGLATELRNPLLIDGDGLTALAEDVSIIREREAPTVLTPHPGEMSRLIGATVAEIVADPIPLVQDAARDLGAVIVLKGAHSLIALPDRRVFINLSGNSGMGTAGSGDVLTGTIAAMHGLGLPCDDAACTGVFVHGLAGDLAAADKGEDGITARDVLEHLPSAVRAYREDYDALTANCYGRIQLL